MAKRPAFVVNSWIRREYEDRRTQESVWHKVESIIDGDAITACGRRLEPVTKTLNNRLAVFNGGDSGRTCSLCRPPLIQKPKNWYSPNTGA